MPHQEASVSNNQLFNQPKKASKYLLMLFGFLRLLDITLNK